MLWREPPKRSKVENNPIIEAWPPKGRNQSDFLAEQLNFINKILLSFNFSAGVGIGI